jgi:DNA-binding IclR family transcriptional regulator
MRLLEELKLTAERGYAIDNGEHEEGIKCFAAPIKGYGGGTLGAISIAGLRREFDDSAKSEKMITAVKNTVAEISRVLGG